MKNASLAIYIFFFACIFNTSAQKKKLANPFETNGNLDSQFIYLEKTSTNYKDYKVITKASFLKLHDNVLDSMANQQQKLNNQEKANNKQVAEIKKLTIDLKKITEDLTEVTSNKNSISVFGISLYKNNYNLIAGSIIIILLAIALFFFYKFNNSDTVTKEAKKNLDETQKDFEAFQKKSLQRQQELNRKLQDEIIKNRKD